jgi:hypothetical protein
LFAPTSETRYDEAVRRACWLTLLVACATPRVEAPKLASAPKPSPWPEVTRSPWAREGNGERQSAITSACGEADGALERVAAALASDPEGRDPDRASALLRRNGEPHVRPRVFTVGGRPAADEAALTRALAAARGEKTRCGVAIARVHGDERIVAVTVEALADLAELPTRGRTGQWLTFEAALHVKAKNVKLLVLGPRGLPRTAPTSLDRDARRVRARFVLDGPGPFDVQLVGELEGGPVPLLEARIWSDVEPGADAETAAAPGEDDKASGDDSDDASRMTAELRQTAGLPPLARNPRLDAVALAHAERMRDRGAIAHDVGEGDAVTRLEEAGVSASLVGENVARARSVALAHRALYASPSHRLNLLRAEYTHVGVGVARSETGVLYVCQVFARLR